MNESKSLLDPGSWMPIISLFMLLLAGLTWGIKLEGRQDETNKKVDVVVFTVAKGILPITEERLRYLNERIDFLKTQGKMDAESIDVLEREVAELRKDIMGLKETIKMIGNLRQNK